VAASEDPLLIPSTERPISGRVSLPGSKSYTNRALPIAALADGQSVLRGALDGDDTRYMAAALLQLGIAIDADWEREVIVVEGCEGRLPARRADLFLGNSGTSMRFLTALAATGRGTFRLDGIERMRSRPLGPLIDGLRSLDVEVDCESTDGFPPVVVRARGLPGGSLAMRGDVSSQYFSALAMVLPYAVEPLEVRVEGDLVSKPYLDMTASTMASFGVTLRNDRYQRFWVEPGSRYEGQAYEIEPDASAASYFFALAAVSGGSITVERLPPTSRQGDIRFVDLLERMGCRIDRGVSDLTVHGPRQLSGIDVDMNDISDTVQTLAAIAPFADSPVMMRNIGHIRLKETDRIDAVAIELRRMGAVAQTGEDWLRVLPSTLSPATIQTYDDHRMAMSFAITAARVAGTRIAHPECVAKTVPQFWELLFPLLGVLAR
jgi:3-phosphoshikimate 1-carboxyvinyltransferase